MNDYFPLEPEDIRFLHDDSIKRYGGIYGENEPGMIDYIAEKPFQILYGQELYPSLFLKASIYLEGFATHQYFCDGNKRTGIKSCLTFLLINGHELIVENEDLFRFTLAVANKDIGIEEISTWLEENCIEKHIL